MNKLVWVVALCGLAGVAEAGFGDFLRKTAEVVVTADAIVNGSNTTAKVETPKTPEVKKMTMDELARKIEAKETFTLIDVRSELEYGFGHIQGAINLPVRNFKKESVQAISADMTKPVVVYCKSGTRAKVAANLLLGYGYTDVTNGGGFDDWKGLVAR